jgi:hypothetical protein
MPKGVTEISQGNQFSRSANEGQLADSATRTFRVLLNSPSEVFDIQASCGVFVGDPHPTNTNIYCASFDAKYEGDTRMVLVATFNYQSAATASDSSGGGGGGSKTISPEIRPANWSVSTELTEVPVREFALRLDVDAWFSFQSPRNPVGDMYEGLTKLQPMTTVKVTQFVLGGAEDPTRNTVFVGTINSKAIGLGFLNIEPHTMMLRSISATPAVESFGRLVRRGWTAEYTFLIRNEYAEVSFDLTDPVAVGDFRRVNIGWDAAIIVEGRNVKAFHPAGAAADQDPYGQPLKPGPDGAPLDPNNLALPDGVAVGSKQRAHVGVTGFSDRGMSQSPAGEPIALNLDGTPRKVSGTYPPIIRAYQIYEAVDMIDKLKLRLY